MRLKQLKYYPAVPGQIRKPEQTGLHAVFKNNTNFHSIKYEFQFSVVNFITFVYITSLHYTDMLIKKIHNNSIHLR